MKKLLAIALVIALAMALSLSLAACQQGGAPEQPAEQAEGQAGGYGKPPQAGYGTPQQPGYGAPPQGAPANAPAAQ